jgi:hypothetical protein
MPSIHDSLHDCDVSACLALFSSSLEEERTRPSGEPGRGKAELERRKRSYLSRSCACSFRIAIPLNSSAARAI